MHYGMAPGTLGSMLGLRLGLGVGEATSLRSMRREELGLLGYALAPFLLIGWIQKRGKLIRL
jgi:hypothetical protein